jgi:hypothetical protein
MQHCFLRNFCSGVSSFGTIVAQIFLISKSFVKIKSTDVLPIWSSSARESALDRCLHRYAKWKGALTFCCPWDFSVFSISLHPLENSVPF